METKPVSLKINKLAVGQCQNFKVGQVRYKGLFWLKDRKGGNDEGKIKTLICGRGVLIQHNGVNWVNNFSDHLGPNEEIKVCNFLDEETEWSGSFDKIKKKAF